MFPTRTATLTREAPQTATLILRASRSLKVQEFVDRFVTIILKNEGNDAPKSPELTRLGEEICEVCLGTSLESDEVLHQLANKVHEIRKILSNQYDGSLIRHPVTANNRLHEAWMIRHIQRVCGNCPIDESPFEEVVPHTFGEELIQWEDDLLAPSDDPYVTELADRIRELQAAESTFGWLREEEVLAMSPRSAREGYRDLARDIAEREKIERLDRIVERSTEEFIQVNVATQESTRRNVAATREALRVNEEALDTELRFIRETHVSIVSDYERQLDDRDNDIRRLEERVGASESRAQALANQLASVQSQLNDLAWQNEQNRAAAADSGGGCSIM